MARKTPLVAMGETAWGALLLSAAVLPFLPSLTAGFVADDFFILSRLKAHDGLDHALAYFRAGFFDYYRPVAFLSHAIDWHLWGLAAAGYHLTNVLIHGVSTILLWRLARRLMSNGGAVMAAWLFAWHAASHEPVSWIAARFDLLATMFGLAALVALAGDGRGRRALGLTTFVLALLSKESAIAVIIIAPAWDVFVARRDARQVIRRVVPLIAIAAGYALVRRLGADLAVAGGADRLPKLVMAAAALALVVLAGWRKGRTSATRSGADRAAAWPAPVALGIAAAAGGALLVPATAGWMAAKLGFVAYAAFFLVSPVVMPAPPQEIFTPAEPAHAMWGLVALVLTLAALWTARPWLRRHPAAVFAVVFTAAALLPVSSMTGGLRYLYLASAGVSLLAGVIVTNVTGGVRAGARALLVLSLVVSLSQVLQAGRAWQWAGAMTRDGVALMSRDLAPCGTKDVLLLTAPVGIRGVYDNFYWEAFDVMSGCAPTSFSALLRVMRQDAQVDVSRPEADLIELRVPHYAGNFVASEDLRAFGRAVGAGTDDTIDTAAGRLSISHEGDTQVFRLALSESARRAELFYYGDGRVRAVETR